MSERAWAALRLAASVGLLVAAFAWLDVSTIAAALSGADPLWLLLAVVFQVPIIVAMGLRWRVVAAGLDLHMAPGSAVREYWASVFLNQVLPLGVAGDLARGARLAHRHGLDTRSPSTTREAIAPAFVAVAVDRFGAQLLLWGLIVTTLPPLLPRMTSSMFVTPGWVVGAIAGGLLVTLVAARLGWRRLSTTRREQLMRATVRAPAWRWHLGVGLASIALHVATLYACGRALDQSFSLSAWWALGLFLLGVGSIPWFFAGWGIRELSLSGAFVFLGARAEGGAALGLLFGLVALVSSLPGATFVAGRGGPDRGTREPASVPE